MPRLKPPAHIQQKTWGYCLPACVQMALGQFDISISQTELAGLLGIRPGIGTAFSQVRRLKQAATVVYHDPALENGPVTAPLNEFLLAWSEMSELTAFISDA